jgi:hypothetical protein
MNKVLGLWTKDYVEENRYEQRASNEKLEQIELKA